MPTNSKDLITPGKVVAIHYTLKDVDGDLIDDSGEGDPVYYLHGSQNIVPGLEEGLSGHAIGDRVHVEVPPDVGYGAHDPAGVQVVGRDVFPDDVDVEVGMQFGAQSPDGEVVPVLVTKIDGDELTIDLNHPLAGKTLHFDVSIEKVREATEQELLHGHPHENVDDDHE